jgi:hypothetical protein
LATRFTGSKCQLKIIDYLSGCQYPSARSQADRCPFLAVCRRPMAVRQCLNIMVHLILNFLNCLDAQICLVLTVKKWRLKIIDYLSGYRYPSARYPFVRRYPSMAVRRRRSVTVRQCLNVMVHLYFFFFLIFSNFLNFLDAQICPEC